MSAAPTLSSDATRPARGGRRPGRGTTRSARMHADPTDQELIGRARTGDERAFRLLVERHEGVVAATVAGMLGRGDDADDVGQETFIRFYRALGDFRGEASVKTYLR